MSNTCKECLNLLLEYLDGTLPAEVRTRLEQHLGGCEPCEDFMKGYRATPKLCREALAAAVPKPIAEKLAAFLKSELKTAK